MTEAERRFLVEDRVRFRTLLALRDGTERFWDLCLRLDAPLRRLLGALEQLLERGWITAAGDRCVLTSAGRELAAGLPDPVRAVDAGAYARVIAGRPLPDIEFFQGAVDADDVVERLRWMMERGDLWGRRVLLLGDDDCIGLAVAQTRVAASVTVLDLDRRVLDHAREAVRREGLDLDVAEYDFAQPLPAAHRDAHDVVLTDPPETELALSLVLSRAAAALRGGGALYLSLSRLEAPLPVWHAVQRDLAAMGLVVTHVLPDRNHYPDAPNEDAEFYARLTLVRRARRLGLELDAPDVVWYRKDLIRAEALDTPRPLRSDGVELDRSFYTSPDILANF